ncbi:MAG: hypothetical protein IPO18_08400 [bacterium]|nr:hypothetical protein [bacterium]
MPPEHILRLFDIQERVTRYHAQEEEFTTMIRDNAHLEGSVLVIDPAMSTTLGRQPLPRVRHVPGGQRSPCSIFLGQAAREGGLHLSTASSNRTSTVNGPVDAVIRRAAVTTRAWFQPGGSRGLAAGAQ